jgi:ATP-dependent RNA helicase SUPV3L1/SUV3
MPAGAAVVLGALSPRTRNAQVEIYQSGDVDYLIATDAIGMGLNLDVDHVAFAQNRKFDGFQHRPLTAAELGQIAGRAGRHVRDGTFGVTSQVDGFDDDMVRKIEAHEFEPVKVLQWRTAFFDFGSIDALKRSAETLPPVEGLTRALPAADVTALEQLSREPDVAALADRPERVALLWDACALPDYRRIAPAQHAELVGSIFRDVARQGHVDETYLSQQVRRAESTEGDIDALSQRIAQIRTWTYVSHRPGWLADPLHWQEKTRAIEDSLSDALHERLTKRFVDRRTSVLMRRLREDTMLEAEISPSGDVLVEGHHVGTLEGFRFTADQSADGEDAKAVRTAAQKGLAQEFEKRADRFANSPNGDLALGSDGMLRWIGAPVATLAATEDPLKPRPVLLADEQLTGVARDRVHARAERFVNYQVETLLKPLLDLKGAEQLTGISRGVAFQLVENYGLVNRRDIAEDIRSLDQDARGALRRLGVRFGAYHIFIPALLKPGPAGLLTLLWALSNDAKDKAGFGDVVNLLASGRTSMIVDPAYEGAFYRLAGYRNLGRRAVRVDILERLADLIRPALSWKEGTGPRPEGGYEGNAFLVTPAMMSILGATAEDMEEILKGLGYRAEPKPAQDVQAKLDAMDSAAQAAAAKAETGKQPDAQETAGSQDPADAARGETPADDAAGASQEQAAAVSAEPAAAEPAAADAASAPAGETATMSSDSAGTGTVGQSAPEALSGETAEGGADAAAEPASDAAAPTEEVAEQPQPVLVWRQARSDQKPRHKGNRNRRGQPATADAGQGAERDPNRPRRGKGKPSGKGERGPRPASKPPHAHKPREERPAKLDPDSPFAKLAALRDQLKK